MIDAIYEKIARKDLSFGCKCWIHEPDMPGKMIYIWTEKIETLFSKKYLEAFWSETDKKIIYENYKIIWHPVMIGDVMDFIERNFPDWIHCIECKKWKILSDNFNDDTIFYCDNEDCEFLSKFYWDEAFCHKMELYDWFWEEKRKPIEEQSDECIEFVYDLISE